MERPQVTIIENQTEVVQNISVSRSEEIALLSKYGFKPQQDNFYPNSNSNSNNLTFEQMIELEESKVSERSTPKPKINSYSIDNGNIRYHSSGYRTIDEDSNFGVEVQVVSDMNIPKY